VREEQSPIVRTTAPPRPMSSSETRILEKSTGCNSSSRRSRLCVPLRRIWQPKNILISSFHQFGRCRLLAWLVETSSCSQSFRLLDNRLRSIRPSIPVFIPIWALPICLQLASKAATTNDRADRVCPWRSDASLRFALISRQITGTFTLEGCRSACLCGVALPGVRGSAGPALSGSNSRIPDIEVEEEADRSGAAV